MANRITSADLDLLKSKISIKTFVRDFPRRLNIVITTLIDLINQFYDADTDTIKAQKANINYINATTIVAQNINFKGNNGEILNYDNLVDEITLLRQRLDNISIITKAQIDTLNGSVYPEQEIAVDSSANLNTSITTGTITYRSYDPNVVAVDSSGVITGINGGYTLVSAANSLESEIVYVHVTN